MPIHFFSEDVAFKLRHPRKTAQWIKKVIAQEKYETGSINYIFCSDSYLAGINLEFLNHKSLTDIITFDTSETTGIVSGDIFISIERVEENAAKFQADFDQELSRVLVHGVLHLMGYRDKSPREIAQMRKKEEAYLSLR